MKWCFLFFLASLAHAAPNACEKKLVEWSKLHGPNVAKRDLHLAGELSARAGSVAYGLKPTQLLEQLKPSLFRAHFSKKNFSVALYGNEVGEVLAYVKIFSGQKAETWCASLREK